MNTGASHLESPLAAKHDWITHELERFRAENPPRTAQLPRDVAEVVDTIHRDPFDPELSVKTLKRRHRIRNNNFSSYFRYAVGRGLREYIEILRLDAAARLLENAELEVYLVAMAVGYEHAETFCRAFQRRFGATPTERRTEK